MEYKTQLEGGPHFVAVSIGVLVKTGWLGTASI
jgi:hypothetical protein